MSPVGHVSRIGTVARRLALVALVQLVAGCMSPSPRPNFVLISIDSLRPDHLGCYGYPRNTSPNLDRLAREAILFENAYSTSTWTLPAHLSLLTGLYPGQHGVLKSKLRLSERVELLPELLARRGYRSAAVVSGPHLHSSFGFARGWERYDDSWRGIASDATLEPGQGPSSGHLHARALEQLDRLAPGPFLLFLHYFDVHEPYRPPRRFARLFEPAVDPTDRERATAGAQTPAESEASHRRALEASYDGEIRWVDHWLGKLFVELDRRGLLASSYVIVTADHGDEFYDHGKTGHGQDLSDATLRIPLLVRRPGGRDGGRRLSQPVSLVDVPPTVAGVAGLERSPVWRGQDLLAEANGRFVGPAPADLFADLHGARQAIVRWPQKLVAPSARAQSGAQPVQLFDLAADPRERDDLTQREPELAARLWSELRAAERSFALDLRRHPPSPHLSDPQLEAELRALGYL